MNSTINTDLREKTRDTAEQARDMVSEGAAAVADGARDLEQKARKEMADSAGRVADASRDTMENASLRLRSSAREAASALSDAAGELSHVVGDEVSRRAGEVRDAITDRGERITESVRDMAERHDIASLPTRAVDSAIGAVSSAADRVSNTSFSALLDDAAEFARRRPVATAVGVAAAAFVVMRMVRASAQDLNATRSEGPARTASRPVRAQSTGPKNRTGSGTRKPAAQRSPAASKA
jgi:hypothetical protein